MSVLDVVSMTLAVLAIVLALASSRFATLARRRAVAAEREVESLRKLAMAVESPAPERPSITCPECGRTSFHPEDIRYRYCGACHLYQDDLERQSQ